MLNNQSNQNKYTQREMNLSDPIRETSARSFYRTGRKHPVSMKELILHIYQQLYTYDVAIRKNQKPYHNPYTDSIIYKTNTGKTIQIPTNVQKTAIASWIKKRHTKQSSQLPPLKKVKGSQKLEEKINYAPCVFAVIALVLMYYVGTRLTK